MGYSEMDKFLRSEETLKAVQRRAQEIRNRDAKGYGLRQSQIVKHNQALDANKIKGLGNKIMSVDLATYMQWYAVDNNFWNDKSNLKKLKASNPELWIKHYK